jgi:hypothetical protein
MLAYSIHSEFHKMISKHSAVSLVLGLALFVPLISIALVGMSNNLVNLNFSIADSALQNSNDILLLVFRSGNLLSALIGTLVLTTESGAMTIYRTYNVFQHRQTALIGKLIVVEGFVLVAGLIAASISVAVFNLFGTESVRINDPLLLILSYALNGLLIALFSFGVSLVVSKTIPALITTLGVLYILPDVVKTVIGYFFPNAIPIDLYLPGNAAGAGVAKVLQGTSYVGINPVVGIASVMVAALVFIVFGLLIQRRKDV